MEDTMEGGTQRGRERAGQEIGLPPSLTLQSTIDLVEVIVLGTVIVC